MKHAVIAFVGLAVPVLAQGLSLAAEDGPVAEQIAKLKKLGARITLDSDKKVIGVNLGERRVMDADLVHLQGLNHLRELDLTRTQVTSKGLKNIKNITSLKKLYLTDTKVDSSGLVNLKGMKALEVVGLSGTKVNDAALDQLQELIGLKQLFCIGTGITDAGAERLRKKLPKCLIANY